MRPRVLLPAALLVVALGSGAALLAGEDGGSAESPERSAPLAPGQWLPSMAGASAVIWAVGDADPPRSRSVARLMRGADRILYLGDVYPTGSRGDFRRWAAPFGGLVRRMAPTPGNHEWPRAGEGYRPFWRRVTGHTPPDAYAFDAGGWRILSVNSEHPSRARMARWLRRQVRPGGDCRLAFWHRPRFSAGRHGDDRSVRSLWNALRGRARIVVNGHDHGMQRLRARDGIVAFVSGAGGRRLYPIDSADPRLAFADGSRFGALRLRLTPGRARWRFVAADGRRVLDSGSLRCRAA